MEANKVAELMKRFPCKMLETGNVRILGRLSYPSLFEKSKPSGVIKESKYALTLLIPKGYDFKVLANALIKVATDNGHTLAQAQVMARARIMDAGLKADKAGYEVGAFYIRAKSDNKPNVIDSQGPITVNEQSRIKAGDYVVATVNPFYYPDPAPGVSCGLQNVAKVATGEAFGAAPPSAEEEFGDILDGMANPDELFGGDSNASGADPLFG